MNTKKRDAKPRIGTAAAVAWIFAAALAILAAGCSGPDEPLSTADLQPAERLYIERYVTLERARAVAFADRETGEALLDSLAAAWDDSAAAEAKEALDGSPPARIAAVLDLLRRIMDAETDSLLRSPGPELLAAPLPEPVAASDPPERTGR